MRGRLALVGGAVVAACLGSIALGPAVSAADANPAHPGHASSLQPPITITIRTVPALAGVRFNFDGMPLITGDGGYASLTEPHNFGQHTLALADTAINRPDRRYRFTRWAGQRDPDQAFLPTVHGLPMRANYVVTAAFTVQCPVRPRFVYQNGRPLDLARISLVTVRSNTGRDTRVRPFGRTWLDCLLPVYRDSALSSHAVTYSVQSVIVSGANVAHAGAQRFRPSRSVSPTIVGSFHSLTITAHDALFGGRAGAEALVTMPDGSLRPIPLGPGHAVTLRRLPQGEYQVGVRAGHSVVLAQTMRLSRNETVNLTAVSPADLAVLGGALVAIVAGLPLLSATRRRQILGLMSRVGNAKASA